MENAGQVSTKSAKESRDEKHKESKLEEQVLKSLGNVNTIEDKFNILLKKFIELEKENKKLNSTIKQHEKRYECLLREKDNLQKEYNKGVLMRDKLEQVCREQQKLIKSVKNESMTKIREEEERRKENQAKFQHSINEINVTLSKNNEENLKLKEDNIEMTKKLKFLAEQYQAREKQLDKINEQVQLETQLHEAKLAKVAMEAAIEKEVLLKEKQNALDELLNCKKSIQELQTREELLKEQLNLYSSKYDDFQNSLQKSNDIFTSYKSEIEKMCKNTKKLEKESLEWRRKWEKSNASLIELATEKQVKDEYITKTTRQMQQLQKLLRTLQAERTTLHQILKDHNIERPSMPALPPEPEPVALPPAPPKVDKMDLMVKNCAELKQTLAKLQGQMNEITSKQSSDRPAPEESKKSKSKKPKGKTKSCPTKDRQQSQNTIDQIPQDVTDEETITKSLDLSTEDTSKVLDVSEDKEKEVYRNVFSAESDNASCEVIFDGKEGEENNEPSLIKSKENEKNINSSGEIGSDLNVVDVNLSNLNLTPSKEDPQKLNDLEFVDSNEAVSSQGTKASDKISDSG